MTTHIDPARKSRRGLALVLGVTACAALAYSSLVPSADAADSARSPAAPMSGRTALGVPGPVVFPLVTSADRRYLQDQNGQPFPILGRVSFSLASLNVSDYQTYLDDTAAKGFNAIELMLINRSGNNAPFDANGQLPFVNLLDGTAWNGSMASGVNPDFTTPNETYWQHIDGILDYARQKGILCFAFPSYAGYNGNLADGWMIPMVANGTTKMTSYGSWIATRYKAYPNIVWLLGGDAGTGDAVFTSSELAVEQAMLSGMQSVSGQLSTQFSATWKAPCIYTDQTDPTLKAAGTLQGAYDWPDPTSQCRRGYAYSPVMPAFLVEEPYDQEGPDGTGVDVFATQPVRRFQWWGWLSSIGGFVCGNGYVYRFVPGDWDTHLNTQGTLDMGRLNAFIKSIPWQTLVPSGLGGMKTLITAGGNNSGDSTYVAAAADPAGALLVAYVPPAHTGSITVDMTALSGPAQASWYNPTTAAYSLISPSIGNTGTYTFAPPGDNGSGYADWVLVLYALTAIPTPTPTSTPTLTPTPTQTPTPVATVYFAVTPCRLVDTRWPTGPLGGPALSAATPRTFAIANVCNVPSTAKAITVNVTVTLPSTAGDYRVFAADIPPPISTNINFRANQTRANNAILALSGDGLGRFTVEPDLTSGTSHLIVDVNGYFR